jgi:hypothetical protein
MSDTPSPDTVGSVRAVSEAPATLSVPRARLDSIADGLERAQVACKQADPDLATAELRELRTAVERLTMGVGDLRDEWDERSAQFAAPVPPQRVIVEVSRQRSDPPSSVAPSHRDALRALLRTRRGKVVAAVAGGLTTLGIAMPERFAAAVVAFVEAFLQ